MTRGQKILRLKININGMDTAALQDCFLGRKIGQNEKRGEAQKPHKAARFLK